MQEAIQVQEQEEWRVIEEFPDYAVSNQGRVKRITSSRGTWIGKILVGPINCNGYPQICLHKNNKSYSQKIHRLVLNTFIGKKKIYKLII